MSESKRTETAAPASSDLLVVSAFGRGEWLAGELANRGWKVTLADVTPALIGDLPSSELRNEALLEAEGPFGLWSSADLPESYGARFLEEGEVAGVDGGFILWMPDGPIEFASRNARLPLARVGISSTAQGYLKQTGESASREARRLRRLIQGETYRQNWVAGLAHQLASSVYSENHLALEEGEPSPLFSAYAFRRPTEKGQLWTQNALRARGVFVRPAARVLDFRVTGKRVDAAEILDEFNSVDQAKSYVWTLTSAESRKLLAHGSSGLASEIRKDLFATLFPGGPADPSWYWERLRVDLGGEKPDDGLPAAFVGLGDPFLPWTHSNLVVFRRRLEARQFDAWIRVPAKARSADGQYLVKMAAEIEGLLSRRLPLLLPKVTVPDRLTVPAHVVFSSAPFPSLETLAVENFFFCGPERWAKLDWQGAYHHQSGLIGNLEKLKERWEADARRQQARDERKKARGTSPGGDAHP